MISALDGVGGQSHAPTAFTPGREQLPIAQEAGWGTGPVWIGAENLTPTGNRSPDRPARRKFYTDYAMTEDIEHVYYVLGRPFYDAENNKHSVLWELEEAQR